MNTNVNAVVEAQEEAPQHVQYAAQVVQAAYEQQLPPTAVFNGLNIAAAALLVDYVASEDGTVDETSLQVAINHFKTGLENAAKFAKEQFELAFAAQDVESKSLIITE